MFLLKFVGIRPYFLGEERNLGGHLRFPESQVFSSFAAMTMLKWMVVLAQVGLAASLEAGDLS